MTSFQLLDNLKAHLARLTLTHDVIVNVVSSQPKRTNALYPNLPDPPKIWLEEFLVTVTTEAEDAAEVGAKADGSGRSRLLMVAALEAYVYTIPATASTLIYISKVDSTGYAPSPGQPRTPAYTRALMMGFLSFHLSEQTAPTPRVFVHLFARSQNQYLFPNSIQGGAKRVTGGAKLCAWWKGLFEEVVIGATGGKLKLDEEKAADSTTTSSFTVPATLTYILPSYESSEARSLLGVPKHTLPDGLQWRYLPPYHPSLPSPLAPARSDAAETPTIASLIPTFSDDPKARFLAELLNEGQVAKTQRPVPKSAAEDDLANHASKRQRTGHNATLQDIKRVKQEVQDEARSNHAKILARVSFNEFWERIGFRQECSSGDVTGFFGVAICPPSPLAGGIAPSVNNNSQEAQLFGIPPVKAHSIPSPVFARVVAALLNHDFGSRELAVSATEQFLASTEKIVDAECGASAWQAHCTSRVSHNADTTGGTPIVVQTEAAPVRLLAVRKKPKPAAPSSG